MSSPCQHMAIRKPNHALILAAGVYMAAILEYLVGEMIDNGQEQAEAKKKKRITPKHLFDGIAHDLDLKVVLKDVIIPGGGVMPFVHPILDEKYELWQKLNFFLKKKNNLLHRKHAPPVKPAPTNRQLSFSSDEED